MNTQFTKQNDLGWNLRNSLKYDSDLLIGLQLDSKVVYNIFMDMEDGR